MANSNVAVKTTLTYPGVDDAPVVTNWTVNSPFTAQAGFVIDIPDTTADCTEYAVDFTQLSIAIVTCVRIENNASNDVKLFVNGQGPLFHIPPGGVFMHHAPVAPGSCPLTTVMLKTHGIQAGAGDLTFHVFGDPLVP